MWKDVAPPPYTFCGHLGMWLMLADSCVLWMRFGRCWKYSERYRRDSELQSPTGSRFGPLSAIYAVIAIRMSFWVFGIFSASLESHSNRIRTSRHEFTSSHLRIRNFSSFLRQLNLCNFRIDFCKIISSRKRSFISAFGFHHITFRLFICGNNMVSTEICISPLLTVEWVRRINGKITAAGQNIK